MAFRRSTDTNSCVAIFTTSSSKLRDGFSLNIRCRTLRGKASTLVTLLEDKSNNCRTRPKGKALITGNFPVKLQAAAPKARSIEHPKKGLNSFRTVMFNEFPVMLNDVKAGKGQIHSWVLSLCGSKSSKKPSIMRTFVHANSKVQRFLQQSLKSSVG